MPNKTFIRITNEMIYDEIKSISKHLSKLNGKVLWHTWAIGMLLALLLGIVSRIV